MRLHLKTEARPGAARLHMKGSAPLAPSTGLLGHQAPAALQLCRHKNTGRKGNVFAGWLEISKPIISSLLSTRNQNPLLALVSETRSSTECPFKTGLGSLSNGFFQEPQPASKYSLWRSNQCAKESLKSMTIFAFKHFKANKETAFQRSGS